MKKNLLPLLLALLLGACSSGPYTSSNSGYNNPGSDRYAQQQDSAPTSPQDISQLVEPVPKAEPKSRYGNPASYKVNGKTYYVLDSAKGYDKTGMASWYGEKFHGYRTSSGEPYDMYKFTAANKVLPLPTYVRVTNLDNNKSVIVRVNDRGPFHAGRIIDLSWAAAKKLDIAAKGTGRVRVQAIIPSDNPQEVTRQITAGAIMATGAKSPAAAAKLYLQAGAFRSLSDDASRLQQQLGGISGLPPVAIVMRDNLYKLWIGPFVNDSIRQQARQRLQQKGMASIPIDDTLAPDCH